MEQQPINNNNKMERNTLMQYKDEEKELSESLYRNLHVMQRFYEPTTEFLLVFEPVNCTVCFFRCHN